MLKHMRNAVTKNLSYNLFLFGCWKDAKYTFMP